MTGSHVNSNSLKYLITGMGSLGEWQFWELVDLPRVAKAVGVKKMRAFQGKFHPLLVPPKTLSHLKSEKPDPGLRICREEILPSNPAPSPPSQAPRPSPGGRFSDNGGVCGWGSGEASAPMIHSTQVICFRTENRGLFSFSLISSLLPGAT